MSYIERYLIKTGPHAGEIHDAVGCNARATPDSEPDSRTYSDGIWVPALGLRFPQERLPYDAKQTWGEFVHYQNLVVAFDKYDNEIFVGDILYASVDKGVRVVRVVKMGPIYHVGCGYITRKMSVVDEDTGQKLTINIPKNTIKKYS